MGVHGDTTDGPEGAVAYAAGGLAVLGCANGFTLWHYRSGDSLAEVTAAGDFAADREMLQAGDFPFANLGDGEHAVLAMGGIGVHASARCFAAQRRAPASAAPAAV